MSTVGGGKDGYGMIERAAETRGTPMGAPLTIGNDAIIMERGGRRLEGSSRQEVPDRRSIPMVAFFPGHLLLCLW